MDSIFKTIETIEKGTKEDLLVIYGEISKERIAGRKDHLIDQNDTRHILEILETKQEPRENLYVLLQSQGGYLSEAISIVEALRGRYREIHFIVSTYAGSAAALMCLSGEIIYLRQKSFLSDFGAQNLWTPPVTPNAFAESVPTILEIFAKMRALVGSGVMRHNKQEAHQLIRDLGGPCVEGLTREGKRHGSFIPIDSIKSLGKDNVRFHHEIPSPGNEVNYIADSIKKLDKSVRKMMIKDKLAKVIAYNGHSVKIAF